MQTHDPHFRNLAAAFIRGRQIQGVAVGLPYELLTRDLDLLTETECEMIWRQGSEAGLQLHKFKRATTLPRVQRVFGILRSLAPARLLDIGSGRGAFLWPLLDGFPELEVCAIDHDSSRARDFHAVSLGGVKRFTGQEMDATNLSFGDRAFEVVTALEVLEHIADVRHAAGELLRVAQRFVIVSVPSKEDNNPEHIHQFDQDALRALLTAAGAHRVSFDYVPGHMIAVARGTGP